MQISKLAIPEVLLLTPKTFGDSRGAFFETYQKEKFFQIGIKEIYVQDNQSISSKGVLRGLHYQLPPRAQAKLIRVLKGEIFDVVVDVRKKSPMFGKFVSITMNAKDRQVLYVPIGFAHGFCTLEDETEVMYKVSDFYSPQDERGVFWNDPQLAIPWPKLDVPYILSGKDQKYPPLHQADIYS